MPLTQTEEQQIKWAIEKHWRDMTDEQIARGLRVPLEQVETMREKMGIERNRRGKESLKAFAQRYLMEMPEEEKMLFMKKLPAELIWKMAEGSPATSGTLDIGIEPVKIEISHQLLKAYGPTALPGSRERLGDRATIVPEYSEVGGESS